ncbi:MAG TPA: SAM-dependent methyltransferase, partial [Verrucomicrobiales bacterium]|nr:SAM-dependent methyltransferase [Verrucomicrobiales bacterium]
MSRAPHLTEIIDNMTRLAVKIRPEDFLYDFLDCFGTPKAIQARLRSGNLNVVKKSGCVMLKGKIHYESLKTGTPAAAIAAAKADKKVMGNKPRFLLATDFRTVAAFDTKKGEGIDFAMADLAENYVFFLPLAGMERTVFQAEVEADVKAAEDMAKLYDLIRLDNPPRTREDRHALNVFLTRLLFCYFAEDTGIFPGESAFTKAVDECTQGDGSDVSTFLSELFLHLNTEPMKGYKPQPHLKPFEYVNGGLFNDTVAKHSAVPQFSTKSRQKLIELGSKSWKEINPDIFGSMFQGVVDDEKRSELGMHYTSVPNILKVIKPLFLDELYDELEKAKDSENKLNKLLARLYRLRLFDPACGSGNFLIITYKELRRLEMAIFKALQKHTPQLPLPGIHVSQFYGIEIDDFACEVAILALWLTEHQMNLEFMAAFNKPVASLPLKDAANIVCANATRRDWETVCPKSDTHQVFLMGNPPYLGARNQTAEHKSDVLHCYEGSPDHKDADLISCWFLKGAKYIAKSNASLAFVTTNSVCQGDHVAILWPKILARNVEIGFAYTSFKWSNSAKKNAGVTCSIIGLRPASSVPKWIYKGSMRTLAANINPYLIAGPNIVIGRRDSPLSDFPDAVMGSMARDGGHLILDREERNKLLEAHPQSKPLIRYLLGSQEFIRSEYRWCLWISNAQLPIAKSIPQIESRISRVYEFRRASSAKTTNGYATIPHQFAQRSHKDGTSMILPRVSSERREYIPYGILNSDSVISDSALAIYNADVWIFTVISSKMHMVWVRAVGGRLEERIRYSSSICYNNFPFPKLTDTQRQTLDQRAEDVIMVRENYPEKSIAWMYDPDTMPADLLAAHRALDLAVEQCYRTKPRPL